MSKNNTLAVALAALLVGGVATAGYMNSRNAGGTDGSRQTPQPISQPLAQPQASVEAPVVGEAVSADALAVQGPRLAYADVLNVRPVEVREPQYATVLGSEPLRESSTVSVPREVCEDVVVQERMPERDGNTGGTVAGAVIGGLVGNQVGKGNGRKAATVAGAVAGGFIGREVDRRHVGGQVVSRTDRQCRTVNSNSTTQRTVGWTVTYRNPDGSTGTMRTDTKPGKRIALGDASRVVGYDVTYRLEGATHTTRMAQRPGSQLPVVDGQVVTQTAAVGAASSLQ